MNEDTVLAQLRDIHLPADFGTAVPIAFALWPFMLLVAVVSAILVVRTWRANRWRRRAKAEFAQIVQVEDRVAQWSMLLAFAASLAHRSQRPITLPRLAYRPPDSVSEAEKDEFIDFLSTELGR